MAACEEYYESRLGNKVTRNSETYQMVKAMNNDAGPPFV